MGISSHAIFKLARTQQKLIDDTVIEETPQTGVFRRRRIGLLKRWADEEVTLSLLRKCYLLSLNVFIGSELPLREHVARQAGVKRVTVHEARGRLIAGLDILARAWL